MVWTLTEAEHVKKRWQEYTEELYKKDLHDLDNHGGVITHLGPDILECNVKWALGSITKRKTTWFPRHRKMKPFPATASQEKSPVRNWRSKGDRKSVV